MQDITIISMIFTAGLSLTCLFLILSPFFKWDAYLNVSTKGQDIASIKEELMSTLNELEFEYKMDKISNADYKKLKKQYEVEVISIMKEEEQMMEPSVDKELMAEVEKEIESQMKTHKNKKGEEK
jgi:hypothetical protein